MAGLLGGSLPAGGFGGVAIAAVAVFAVTGMLTVWPVDMDFSGKLGPLLTHLDENQSSITDENRSATARQYERDLAGALDRYRISNEETIKNKSTIFTCACALLGVQVVLWAIARLVA